MEAAITSFFESGQMAIAPFLSEMTPELALFALAVAFFAFSAALCAMAVRAAGAARDAQEDARVLMRTVQDYAVEMRQLAAQTERGRHADADMSAGLSDRIRSVRVGSRYDSGEAQVEVDDAQLAETDAEQTETASPAFLSNSTPADPANDARLAEAARAATEPRSLLANMLRRRAGSD